jgi:pimeloyl-ACP methyl ester carboxylesterase
MAATLMAVTLMAVTLTACGSSPTASGPGPAAIPRRTVTGNGTLAGQPTTADEVRAGAQGGAGLTSFYRVPSPLSPAPPGTVIRSQPISADGQLPPGATAYRVVYHSETIDGTDTAVSGVVVVPGGAPPPGGFPIVSWAHGTTGLSDQCAPSVAGFGAIPYLATLLDDRMIVAATDYEGLGTVHPYLVGQSEGQGVLDAARAARTLVGVAASNTVVVLGYSQGGQAALFAGQIAQSYAPELFVAGVVSVAPVTSLTELAPAVPGGTTDPDSGFAAMALYAWSATYRTFALSSVLAAEGLRHAQSLGSACSGTVGAVYDAIPTDLLFRPGWSRIPAVSAADALNQPGNAPISAPVLVVQGTRDSLVPYRTTTSLVDDTLCRDQHDEVRYAPIKGASHSGALLSGQSTIERWIVERVHRQAPANTCPG